MKEKAIEMLTAVGLADRLDHLPYEMSGGQAQRVAIARALVNDPVIILADEPTGNLDSKSGEEIMTVLSDLHKQGRTIVMVTHDQEIADFADRNIHFLDGRIDKDLNNGQKKTAKAEDIGKGKSKATKTKQKTAEPVKDKNTTKQAKKKAVEPEDDGEHNGKEAKDESS